MPANTNHFAYTKGETTIVLFGQGPVDFKYVNPADDPRDAVTVADRQTDRIGTSDQDPGQRDQQRRTDEAATKDKGCEVSDCSPRRSSG